MASMQEMHRLNFRKYLRIQSSHKVSLRFSNIIRTMTLRFYNIATTSLCNLITTLPAGVSKYLISKELATSIQQIFWRCNNVITTKCVKYGRIRVFSDPYFPDSRLILHSDVLAFAGISNYRDMEIFQCSKIQVQKFKSTFASWYLVMRQLI